MATRCVLAMFAAVFLLGATGSRVGPRAAAPDPLSSFFLDKQQAEPHRARVHPILLQQHEQQHQRLVLSETNMYIIAVAVFVVLLLGIAAFVFFRRRQALEEEGEEGTAAEGNAVEGTAAGDLREPLKGEVAEETESPGLDDYESLFKKLAQKGAQTLGPKLEKGNEVRTIIEGKVSSFQQKAKALVMSELNDAAGSVCKALDADEAMLMLDWDAAVAANFPPASVLIAGCLVPATLALSNVSHTVQILLVQLPVFGLGLAAEILDWNHPCLSIPGIRQWAQCTCVLTFLIIISRLVMLVRTKSAEKDLKAKADEMKGKLTNVEQRTAQAGGKGLADLRELFICHSTMLQYAVVCESRTRATIFNHIVGFGTLLWLFLIGWVTFITSRYTFVPGVVAFHPSAADDPAYCAAWMTVVAARISVLLGVLFLFVNIFTVIGWLLETSLSTASIAKKIEDKAKEIDSGMMGLPVAQLLVKSLLFRGTTDVLSARLAVAFAEKSDLAKEYADVESRLSALKAQMDNKEEQVQKLTKEVDLCGGTLEAQADHFSSGALDLESLRKQGEQVIEERRQRAMTVQDATTDEIDRLVEKIRVMAEQFEQSEAVQAAERAAKEGYDKASAAALDAADKIQNSEQFKQARAKAQAAIEQIQDPALMKKMQAQAKEGLAQAQAKAAELQEMASDPEMRRKAEEALANAQAQVQALQEQAQAIANDPELQEKVRAAGAQASSAVQATADQAKKALEDPELMEKAKASAAQAQEAVTKATKGKKK